MHVERRNINHQQSGSLLMIVLWAIAFVSVLIIALLPQIHFHGRQISSSKMEFKAYQLAKRGLEIAKHSNVQPGDPLLRYEDDTSRYSVRLTSEERLIPFVKLLEPEYQASFMSIFRRFGLSTLECERLLDEWLDWMDEDSNRRLKGAEASEYRSMGLEQLPLNQKFTSWTEVKAALGVRPLDQKCPGWEKHFTLSPTEAVDLNEASPEVLHLITGVELILCRAYREKRLGNDQILGTTDDWKAENVESALRVLGIRSKESSTDHALFQTQSKATVIESVAALEGATIGVHAIMGSDGQWREQLFVPATK